MDDMGEGIEGWGLGGMMGVGSWADGGVGEWNVDKRDRWGQAVRNSSAIGMLSSRVNEELSLQARVSADCY